MNKKAFTLIELLVVVLIIGILAAIALPQYQKAVLKSRLAEVAIRIKSLEQAIDLYVLEQGYPASGSVDLFEVYSDLTGGLTKREDDSFCTEDDLLCYVSNYALYQVYCSRTECNLTVHFSKFGKPQVSTPGEYKPLSLQIKRMVYG